MLRKIFLVLTIASLMVFVSNAQENFNPRQGNSGRDFKAKGIPDRMGGKALLSVEGFALNDSSALPVSLKLQKIKMVNKNKQRDAWDKMVDELEGGNENDAKLVGIIEIDGDSYGIIVKSSIEDLKTGTISADVVKAPEGNDPAGQMAIQQMGLSGGNAPGASMPSGRIGQAGIRPPGAQELFGESGAPDSREVIGSITLKRNKTPNGASVMSGSVSISSNTMRLILSATSGNNKPQIKTQALERLQKMKNSKNNKPFGSDGN